MRSEIVKIGNSRGIRIPKALIEESGINREVELTVDEGKIIIKPVSCNRTNWSAAFSKMAKNNDDLLLDKTSLDKQTKWDAEEWEW